MRFVAVQEPPGSSWAVFDAGNGAPAEYAGRVLIGLTWREARWFVAAGNDHRAWPRPGRPAGQLRLVSGGGSQSIRERHGQTGS
ncbi:hypothetical protein RFM41_27060 [Mesorhizobium sp. VK25A]|uniref:Uncharacterized protein n=1 Tax=Mesorhizobium vachelliae TaxID=3072309 RepID=A0ABU5AAE0_9HYPH|nr:MULTISPECIES: hypothetical protein [unclassified Mesorhizobium]MDX8534679.1 hypothetical protein [Mesorhizobium sp. VK25D]MDX8547438.1 hypothetical protein [Mesorhizobium sp. VK25A]